jgi:hypothetical protein
MNKSILELPLKMVKKSPKEKKKKNKKKHAHFHRYKKRYFNSPYKLGMIQNSIFMDEVKFLTQNEKKIFFLSKNKTKKKSFINVTKQKLEKLR